MFRLPTRTVIRPGAIDEAASVVPAGSHVVLVTDAGLQETEWPDRVRGALERARCTVSLVDDVRPNPRVAHVNDSADRLRSLGPDIVVGLGGGSALDAAKGMAVALSHDGPVEAYEGKNRFAAAPLPVVAIPTTCGTGSEVTWVSVLSLESERRKISIKGDALFPSAALVDPDTLRTLPASLIAATGLDAMTHAVEAYLSKPCTPASEALAERAVADLLVWLRPLVDDPAGAHEARGRVMAASTMAGMAFGNADVGAVHCLSEAVGGRHDHPHGALNASLLVPVVRRHGPVVADRLARLSSRAGSPDVMADIDSLLSDLPVPRFADFGVPRGDFAAVAAAAEANGSNESNLRRWRADDYLEVLNAVG